MINLMTSGAYSERYFNNFSVQIDVPIFVQSQTKVLTVVELQVFFTYGVSVTRHILES